MTDEQYMRLALQEAQKAFELGEIPVGAIIVGEGIILARTHNLTELLTDVTAHAEILAIGASQGYLASKYLDQCTLYVTLEPCVMCAGAVFWSNLKRVVYGASDEKRGFAKFSPSIIHPKTEITKGILEQECADLMKGFFKKIRK